LKKEGHTKVIIIDKKEIVSKQLHLPESLLLDKIVGLGFINKDSSKSSGANRLMSHQFGGKQSKAQSEDYLETENVTD
jgi:hypothetical protein